MTTDEHLHEPHDTAAHGHGGADEHTPAPDASTAPRTHGGACGHAHA